MGTIKTRIVRTALTFGAAVVAICMTTSTAHADLITFVVDEGAVPGANDVNVTPDPNDITGKYREVLFIGTGTFTEFFVVDFTGYVSNGVPVTDQIGAPVDGGETDDTNLYGLYALVTASGTFSSTDLGAGNTALLFEPTSSTVDVYTDPYRDTEKDYTTATVTGGDAEDQPVMTASALDQGASFGAVFLNASPKPVTTGSYALVYTNVAVLLDSYWPTLSLLSLRATASGDVDTSAQGSVFPTDIHGDTDVTFEELPTAPVPEPASLLLLGSGLLGLAARRRRASSTTTSRS